MPSPYSRPLELKGDAARKSGRILDWREMNRPIRPKGSLARMDRDESLMAAYAARLLRLLSECHSEVLRILIRSSPAGPLTFD